jgi:ferritin-like metal-binding protein YciE
MFERFTTPEEIFSFKLGTAMTMEKDSLELLDLFEQTTPRPELKSLFHAHDTETRRQLANLERCFTLLGERPEYHPSPATKGLAKELRAAIAKTDSAIVDAVLLAAAIEAEHHEMAVYETLITHALARGADELAQLLQQNYDQEVSAGADLLDALQRLSDEGIAVHPVA